MPQKRLPTWLFALFLGSFAVGTDDFVIAGVLPSIATDLHVSEAAAGQLVTVFSVSFAVFAPVAAVITARWQRRTVMIAALALFAAGNLLAAVAPGYPALLAARVLLAIAAATISPTAVAIAATNAPAKQQGRYISLVAAGLTVSLAAGVPLGTWIGGTFGWRTTFVFVAALAAIALCGMRGLPHGTPHREGLRERLAPLRRPLVLVALLSVSISAAGGLMLYEYVAPVTRLLSGVTATELAVIIALTGISGAVGTWIGGRATDRFGPERTIAVTVGSQASAILSLALLAFMVTPRDAPLPVVVTLLAAWALAGWAFNPAMHLRLIRVAGDAGAEVAGLNLSALFLGVAVAGGLGGAVLAQWTAAAVPLASGSLSLVGLGVFGCSLLLERRGALGRQRHPAVVS